MSKISEATAQSGDTWDFTCPDCEFSSTGWETKKLASARGEQHFAEHAGEGPMPELAEFRAAQEG